MSSSKKLSRDETGTNEGPPLAVHVAVINNDLKNLQQLIQSGAPQLHKKTYETALHVAARTPALECMKWLLDNYINSPRDQDCNGSTPCHYAVVYGNLDALKMLLAHDSRIEKELTEMREENGLTIIGLATLQGDVPTVEWIVNKYPGLAYIKDNSGNLPIHLAAAGGSVEIVRLLVERYGRDYAIQSSSEKKFQPLYYAVDKGKTNVVKYLIEEVKVDPLAKAKGGMTTLHAAVTAHQVTITKWLIEKLGPNVILSKSDDGATLLHLAAAEGLPELLEYFINVLPDHKTAINVSDDSGSTPAHDAAEFGEIETLIVLLKHGADITLMNQNQETPFDLAVGNRHNEIIKMITEFRESGPKALNSYGNNDNPNVRTSKKEAEEITGLIQQATNIVEKRKEEEVTRKISLQRLTDDDELEDSSGDELERELMKDRENDRVSRSKFRGSREEVDTIPHEAGPDGSVYAKIKKNTIERKKAPPPPPLPPREHDNLSEVGSVVSSHRVARLSSMEHQKNRTSGSRLGLPENDSTSSIGTSVSHSKKIETYHNGNGSGFHPPYGGYYPPPPHPGAPYYHPSFHRGGPRSTASGSSTGSFQPPHSLPPGGYPQYPYMPAMVAQYYGYPYPPQYYPMHPKAKGINERIHMEALQKTGGGQPFLAPPHPGYRAHPKYGPFGHMRHHSRPTSSRSSAKSVPVNRSKAAKIKHTDRAIGFGPTTNEEIGGINDHQDEDHPAPPPITKGGKIETNPTELLHANFIMMKADKEGKVPTEASSGTKLQRAKPPDKYDGRYNNYIESDSEDERELSEHIRVSTLAESALILMMIPILGLKGNQRNKSKDSTTTPLSPKAYDELEAQKTSKQWSHQQNVVDKFKQPSTSKSSITAEITDWSEMLGLSTPQPTQTKDISGSIRARNTLFQGFKPPSMTQSMASLVPDDDDDDDDDIISVVIGNDLTTDDTVKEKHKKQHSGSHSTDKHQSKSSSSSKKEKSKHSSSSSNSKRGTSAASNKQEKSTASKLTKKSSGDKESATGSHGNKKTRSSQKTDLKKKSSKEREGGAEKKSFNKKLKMTVQPTTKTTEQENIKEMQLKKSHLTNDNNQVVTSVSVKTKGETKGGQQKGPVELPNIAIIDVTDSEEEIDSGEGEVNKRKIATPTSPGSFDVDNIFAETEKEIEQMLAGMPPSNVETDTDDRELRDLPSKNSHEEHVQLEKLQGMFPQNSTTQQQGGEGGENEMLSIIEALKMKPEEITPQQKMRIQLIQNILVGKDPELRAQLLSLMSQGWSPTGEDNMSTNGSSTQLIADIENKLLESQEKQRKETEEHFRSQAQFTETLQRRLEEQAARHMENIQMQLNLQKEMMTQQLEEQKRLLEQERKRVSEQGRVKIKSKHKVMSSDDSDSGDELVLNSTPHPVMLAKQGRTNTMTAKIQHQSPLKWEDFTVNDDDKSGIPEPPPIPQLSYLLEAVDDPAVRRKKVLDQGRRATKLEFENTSRALEKFTSLDIIPISDEEEEEEEREEDRELKIAKAKIATRKKADIVKVQQNLQKKSLSSFVQNTRFGGSSAKTMVVS